MALLILAALLGSFGPGLLGHSTVGEQKDTLWVEYDHFSRRQAEAAQLIIHVGAEAVAEDRVQLSINEAFLAAVSVTEVVPAPENISAAAGTIVYTFRTAVSHRPLTIHIRFEPESIGPVHGQLTVMGGPTLHFDEFIYP